MRKMLVILTALMIFALPALADKVPAIQNDAPNRVFCDFTEICLELDLAQFASEMCDAEGMPVWQYGQDVEMGVPTVDCYGEPVIDVLGTILNGDYLNDAGDRAVLPPSFVVSPACNLLELCHYYDIENSFDGGNVEVLVDGVWVVIDPIGGYPDDEISDSSYYYAWCVDGEPGFTDDVPTFVADCFDLSEFMGMEILVGVTFGSDDSVNYPGWYIDSVTIGGMTTAADNSDWSTIKALY